MIRHATRRLLARLAVVVFATTAFGRASASPTLASLEARTQAFTEIRWGASDRHNVRLMSLREPARMRDLTNDLLEYAAGHPDVESVSAATFLIARARFAFADALEAVPTPRELETDPRMISAYRSQIAEFARPMRAQGRKGLSELIEHARASNVVNPWVAEAQALLEANPAPVADASPGSDTSRTD